MAGETSLADALLADPDIASDDDSSVVETPTEAVAEETPVETTAPTEEPTETAETEPVSEEPPGEPQSPADVFAIAEKMGKGWIKDKYADPDAALHGLVHAADKLRERDEDAAYGRELKQYQQQFSEYLQSLNEPPPPQQQPEVAPPQFDSRLLQFVEVYGDTGVLVPKEDAPPGVMTPERLAAAQAYVDYEKQRREQFKNFDPEAITKSAEEKAMQAIDQRFEAQRMQQEAQQVLLDTISQPWFFERDASGNVVRDMETGAESLSVLGRAYQQWANHAYYKLGITNPRDCDDYARAKALAVGFQQQAAPAPQVRKPAPTPPGGTHTRTVMGDAPKPVETQQSRSLYEQLMLEIRNAEQNGSTISQEFAV